MTSSGRLGSMRAVVLEMPPHWLEERRRLGHDIRDEVWDGVLHMVPQPGTPHMRFSARLQELLVPLARARGYEALYELALYGSADDKNYRVPDLVVVDPVHLSQRGVEKRAEVAVEILSPNDESHEKLPFYAMCGVREVWLVDPRTRVFEIYWIDDNYTTVRSESAVLGVKLSTVDGPLLRLEWSGGAAEI